MAEINTKINPIDDYIKQMTRLVSIDTGKDLKESEVIVRNELKTNKNIINPTVKFRERDLNGNVKYDTTSLKAYIDYVKNKDYIMAPSFTVYFDPKTKRSLHSGFAVDNTKERSVHKKEAFNNRTDGNMVEFKKHYTLQSSLKIFNNSLSGAYLAGGSVLFNPSAHYTLTSVVRGMAGVGNSLSESMITGTRHYRSPDIVTSHMLAMIDNIDMNNFKMLVDKYKLYLPTPDEVMEHIVIKNIKRYWSNTKEELKIFKLLKNMSAFERAIVTYVNDLYHLAFFNDKLIRDMVGVTINTTSTDNVVADKRQYLKELPGWASNLMIHANMNILTGQKIDYGKLEESVINTLFISGSNIIKGFASLDDLINALFLTDVYTTSVAYVKDMVRDSIVLSDTDSTCATYQNWSEWWTGKLVVNKETIGVATTIMTIVTKSLGHYVQQLGLNMNVSAEKASILQMKNEFFWDVFANTDVSKHYYSMVKIQEGNVLSGVELEKKGVHLIASKIYEYVRGFANDLMINILQTIGRGEEMSMLDILNKVADVEQKIIDLVKSGDTNIFNNAKIKNANTYKLEAAKSPYINHMLWEEVFSAKYGNAPEPEYMALKIPTKIGNKKDMDRFVDNIKDAVVKDKFRTFLDKYDKETMKTFILPKAILNSNGLPKELLSIINTDKIVKDNCNVLYIILSSLGYYIKPDTMVLDILNRGENR